MNALGRRLLTHIALRLVAATVLLGAALIVQVRAPGVYAVNPFFILIAAVYAVSLAFIASLRFVDRWPWLTDVHFAMDVLMVSAAVSLTGGIISLFTSLYVLPIVAASTLQFRRGALQVAAFGSLMYAGIVLAQYAETSGLIDPILGIGQVDQLPRANVAQYTVGLNVFGLFAVAFLSGSLAERVRRADVQLEQASEELADLQFFNEYVIDNLVSGLATADSENRLLTFNRSAVLITGHGLASVMGKSAVDVLQLPSAFNASLDDDLMRARSKRTDFQYHRGDNRVIDLGLSVAQLPLPDGRRGYLYTFQDVTDLKRLERGSQMQTRLAAVGEMAAGIAHEIRNPLASMSGSMQMLRQELALTSEQAQLMDIVMRESERLNGTIRAFLAYARPQRFEMEHLDLRGVLVDTATLLRNSHERGDRHTIDVRLPDEEVIVEADENQIRQIVWNLATNGLRAMPQGGTLILSAAREDSDAAHGSVLTVTDHGVGMAAEEIEGMFQPFRGSFSKGTGLGLAIVHRIISDYNARVDVQSQPGHGTTFRVTFPPIRAPKPGGEPRTPAQLTS
ncbi:MAG TPA: ATP-binding protein [Vicinamibacterales bacterium]|nr:ATP-binding protein [Vicinamibacterales bacterium]